MIKSAIVTTSNMENLKGGGIVDLYNLNPTGFYVMGAGHANLVKANNPDHVYDTQVGDYTAYLYGLEYIDAQVSAITQTPIICSSLQKLESTDMNYGWKI